MIAVVLCTGQSLTQADVDYCRGKAKVVAVSDAIFMAPWADAMVAYDKAWWIAHPEVTYTGPKFMHHIEEVPGLDVKLFKPGGGHSGTLGCLVAMTLFKPEKIILLGADMVGTHFFGPHKRANLRNTTLHRFEQMRRQFADLRKLPIVNCTRGGALECFRRGDLRTELADLPQRAAV